MCGQSQKLGRLKNAGEKTSLLLKRSNNGEEEATCEVLRGGCFHGFRFQRKPSCRLFSQRQQRERRHVASVSHRRIQHRRNLFPYSNLWFRSSLQSPLVDLCGHATLASAHCLFSLGLVDLDRVEFVTRSGILTAKRVSDTSELNDGEAKGGTFLIELNFPVVQTSDINLNDDDDSFSMITKALNGATIVDIKATSNNNIIVVLPSSESVSEVQPRMDVILKYPCTGVIVTAAGSQGSVYDFYSRYFTPKFGVDEDPVCGSAHCALAHYWSLKMNKCDFLAYQASSRSGTIRIHYDKEKQRVLLRGKAVTVMEGHVLV